MSDDLREREPRRDQGDHPAQEGLRSDHAGTSATLRSPAPPEDPPDNATSAGGGYGSASAGASSGGSGEGETPAGEDPQTDWLREED